MEQNQVVSVRMPTEVQAGISSIAKQWDRSQNWVINQAIEQFLDLYRWQAAQIEKAVAAADAGGRFYSSEEVEAMIDAFKP